MESVTANQYPHLKNRFSRSVRTVLSYAPECGFIARPDRPVGISVVMRVKDEADWIEASVESIKGIAEEIIIVDNGSSDGTYEILEECAFREHGPIKLWRKPELHHCELSNFALEKTSFRWVFRWDGDMVAHTSGAHPICELRERILSLDKNRYFLIYLRHINLSGDLFHQDPKKMVHIEEYIHTYSEGARFIHPGRFEAVKFPVYYKPLFWYEPYAFHVNVKPARRMLLRYFWEEWMERKDYERYPTLEEYVTAHVEREFGTTSTEEAQKKCVNRMLRNHIPFEANVFGPYPELLKPLLQQSAYRIQYKDGQIATRVEPEDSRRK